MSGVGALNAAKRVPICALFWGLRDLLKQRVNSAAKGSRLDQDLLTGAQEVYSRLLTRPSRLNQVDVIYLFRRVLEADADIRSAHLQLCPLFAEARC
jgi:hypothetical protein